MGIYSYSARILWSCVHLEISGIANEWLSPHWKNMNIFIYSKAWRYLMGAADQSKISSLQVPTFPVACPGMSGSGWDRVNGRSRWAAPWPKGSDTHLHTLSFLQLKVTSQLILEIIMEKYRVQLDSSKIPLYLLTGFIGHSLKKVNESKSHSVVSNSLQPHELYSPWNSAGQNTGVGSRSLLQGIFPIQGLNPGLPHCRRILYQLSHQGSPWFIIVKNVKESTYLKKLWHLVKNIRNKFKAIV